MGTDLVTIFGGTGFLGRAIVRRLAQAHKRVRIASRHPSADQAEDVEQVQADIRDITSVRTALAGAGAVVNAVALYVERGRETFDAVHVQGALNLAQEASRQNLQALVHISGIGADPTSSSAYVRARAEGERRIREAFGGATILRPSVLFGANDAFLSTLDQLTGLTPVIPLFGAGETRLQPVYVEDVAEAVTIAMERPDAVGRTYELGGADTYTYKVLLKHILRHRQRHRALLPVPFGLWEVLARLMSVLPTAPITRDQIALMRQDNVVSPGVACFADLGISPRSLTELLPLCLRSSADSPH